MKISPVSSTGNTVGSVTTEGGSSAANKLRSLRMNTNATPGYEPDAPALTIPDGSKEETPAATEETQPLSPQFAALAKARRALQAKEREIADREKALIEKSATPADTIDLAKLKSDPLGVMLGAGVTYDQLTEAVLAQQNGSNLDVRALKEELLKSIKEDVNKTLTEKDARSEQAALAEMRKEAILLSAQGEDFELIRETGSIPVVMSLIEKTYRETGDVMDVKVAMGLVENELITDSLKLAKLNKVQSQIAPQTPPPPTQQQRQMRTLTNRDTASVPMSAKQRALAAFRGTLQK